MENRKVALFATNFVSFSQTFIYDEVRSHKKYAVDVYSLYRMNKDIFPYENVHSFFPADSLKMKIEGKFCEITSLSPTRKKLIANGGYSLIHAHFGTGSIYALPFADSADLPLVVTFHGYDVPILKTYRRFFPEFWRYWLLSGKMFRRVDLFLAASDELNKMLVELGAPAEKVKTWRLGVEIPEISKLPERSGKRIIMVGRFVEKKGFEYAIEAFAKVIKSGADAVLDIIGDGPLKNRYISMIKKLNIENKVIFHGVKKHREVLDMILNSDILLAPSVVATNGDRESGILVVKEAGARSVPAIGTIHGGIPEIIDEGKTGFLVNEKDVKALAERITLLLGNEILRQKMGAAARKKMENEYSLPDRVEVLESYYDSVIEKFKERKND
ncbi:MAG TPA: glycosyltransferase [bacterium]|nr:glycosyltransferase [bacterium]HPS30801.1 glycosyltransferase [bacterium]